MAQDAFDAALQRRRQAAVADPFDRALARRRKKEPEKPSILETAGMVARGIPAAIGGEVALTGAKLSGALGFEEAAEYQRGLAKRAVEAFRPKEARLQPAFETSRMIASVPATIAKYAGAAALGVAAAPAALPAAAAGALAAGGLALTEAVGSRPEESEAGSLGQLAGAVGMQRTERALTQLSQTPAGRALASAALSAVPEIPSAVRTGRATRALRYTPTGARAAFETDPSRMLPSQATPGVPVGAGAPQPAPLPAPMVGAKGQQGLSWFEPTRQRLLPAGEPGATPWALGAPTPRTPVRRITGKDAEAINQGRLLPGTAEDVQEFLAQQSASAIPPASPEDLAKFTKRSTAKLRQRILETMQRRGEAPLRTAGNRGGTSRPSEAELEGMSEAQMGELLNPDGTYRLTAEEMADPATLKRIAPKRVGGDLSKLTDRQIDAATMLRQQQLGDLEPIRQQYAVFYPDPVTGVRTGTLATELGDATATGSSYAKGIIRKAQREDQSADVGKGFLKRKTGVSAEERRRLGYDMSEEALGALESAGFTAEDMRAASKSWNAVRLQYENLRKSLDALAAETTRRQGARTSFDFGYAEPTVPAAAREAAPTPPRTPVRSPGEIAADRRRLDELEFETEGRLNAKGEPIPPTPSELKEMASLRRKIAEAEGGALPGSGQALAGLAPSLASGGLGAATGEDDLTPGERAARALAFGAAAAGGGYGLYRYQRAKAGLPPRTLREDLAAASRAIQDRLAALEPTSVGPSSPLGRVPAAERKILRQTPEGRALDIDDYIRPETFSDDVGEQNAVRRAMERVVRETDVDLRYDQPVVVGGRQFDKGDLENPQTWDSVRRAVAKEMGLDPADIASRTAKGERMNGTMLLRIRTALNQAIQDEAAITKALASNTVPADQLESANLALTRVRQEINVLANSFSAQRTGLGRDLNTLKITALSSADPATWMSRLQDLAQRALSDAERARVVKLAGDKDIAGLLSMGAEVRKATWQEKFAALFKAGLLTAPSTHVSNLVGNVTMQQLEVIKDIPATLFDMAIGAATGVRTKDLNVRSLARASASGAWQGLQDAKQVLKGGMTDIELASKSPNRLLEGAKQVQFDSPLLNLYTQGVFRTLGASDAMFKRLSFVRSIDEQARVLAKQSGLTGDAAAQEAKRLASQPSDEMVLRAITDAEVATFNDNTRLAQAALDLRRRAGLPGDILFPFARTPANIATRIVEYSPLGFAEIRNVAKVGGLPADQRRVVEALGRASVGTGAMALGYLLAQRGQMTGFFPKDPAERKRWATAGKLEGAIQKDGVWYQMNRISPLGNLMQIGAALHDVRTNPSADLLTTGVAGATAPLRTVSELPMVANIGDLIKAFGESAGTEGAGEAIADIAARQAQGFIPAAGLVRAVTRTTDPNIRETKGATFTERTTNRFLASLPIASETLPVKRTPLGTAIQRVEAEYGPARRIASGLFNPFQRQRATGATDPVARELERVQATVPTVSLRPGETQAQYAKRQEIVGRVMRNVAARTMASPGYRRIATASPDRVRAILQQAGDEFALAESNLSDDEIRTRLQSYVMDRAMSQAKTRLSRAMPKPAGPPRRFLQTFTR